ncbi:hypothetical protein MKX62_23925 [Sporosarcina sp. FSL K6-5500]
MLIKKGNTNAFPYLICIQLLNFASFGMTACRKRSRNLLAVSWFLQRVIIGTFNAKATRTPSQKWCLLLMKG